ncbi:MAG: Sec-independent protein translocase subunit TatA/TatB [Ignavibacteriaceae bacterium]
MFDNIGMGEFLIIAVVILLLFGSKKIPDFAQGLGKGIREFKKAVKDVEDEIKISPDKENKTDKK